MMNRKTLTWLTLMVVCLAAAAALAQEYGKGPGHGHGRGGRHEMMVQHLELTEDQQEAIDTIREENQAANRTLAKESTRLENELEGELLKDEPSEKKVLDLNAELGELRTQRKANGLKTRLAVRKQLTPEQQDKMLTLRAHRGRGGRHGCGGHGQGCEEPGRGRGRGEGRRGRSGNDVD